MGLATHDATIEHLVDLAIEVQTVRSCLTAAERDPRFTATGYCLPNHSHLAVGGIAILKARQRMAEILRVVPGSARCRRRTAISPRLRSPPGWRKRSAEAVIPPCSARPCCRWPGITSHRRSTAASRLSSCMPAAAFRLGAADCDAVLSATMNSRTPCFARLTWICRKLTSAAFARCRHRRDDQ